MKKVEGGETVASIFLSFRLPSDNISATTKETMEFEEKLNFKNLC
ncbi:hypothetical protein [Parafilimonas sp.]